MKVARFVIGASAILLAVGTSVIPAIAQAPRNGDAVQVASQAREHRPVLLISIDGLSPDSLSSSDEAGPAIPVLRRLMRDGSFADRVVNVNPTVTNPNHTTMVTGVSPARHGIFNNRPFAATARLPDSYSQYGSIQVPTLWSAAKEAGLRTASVFWPVTKDAAPIDINIIAGDSHDDEQITKDALRILAEHRPHFLTVHYVSYDSAQHAHGPGSAGARTALEKIDREIGKLIAAHRARNPGGVVAIVSDHGFDRTTRVVNLTVPFADAGLVTFTDETHSEVKSWRAFPWYVGGSAMVVLRDPDDAALEAEVATFLAALAERPDAGIAAILGPKEAQGSGLPKQVRFVIALQPGYRMGNATKGDFSEPFAGGSHGAFASATARQDMHSSFILVGDGIAANRSLGTIDIRQIAPTLAGLLDVSLPTAQVGALPLGQ